MNSLSRKSVVAFLLLLGVWTVSSQFTSHNGLRDPIIDVVDNIIDGMRQINMGNKGHIKIPDLAGASDGYLATYDGPMRHQQNWGRADPETANPRQISFNVGFPQAEIVYKTYKPNILFSNRSLSYYVEDMDFNVIISVTRTDSTCTIGSPYVEVNNPGKMGSANVDGGFIPSINRAITLFVKNSLKEIAESVKEDVDKMITQHLKETNYNCDYYFRRKNQN